MIIYNYIKIVISTDVPFKTFNLQFSFLIKIHKHIETRRYKKNGSTFPFSFYYVLLKQFYFICVKVPLFKLSLFNIKTNLSSLFICPKNRTNILLFNIIFLSTNSIRSRSQAQLNDPGSSGITQRYDLSNKTNSLLEHALRRLAIVRFFINCVLVMVRAEAYIYCLIVFFFALVIYRKYVKNPKLFLFFMWNLGISEKFNILCNLHRALFLERNAELFWKISVFIPVIFYSVKHGRHIQIFVYESYV